MKWILLVAVIWSAALCEEIISEASHIQLYSSDSNDHGDHGDRHFEEDEHHLLKQDHGGHAGRKHGSQGQMSSHGQKHNSHHDLGSHSAQGSSGSHHGNDQQYHDRDHYSREKHYGYEKAYGYDRVTKNHDKAGKSQSYGANNNQHSQHSQHKKGAQGGQSHAHQSKHQQHEDDFKGQYGRLLNQRGYQKQGRDHHNRHHSEKHINLEKPTHHHQHHGGFSSGLGGGIRGLHGNYGYGGNRQFPMYNRHHGNTVGYGQIPKHHNYGVGYDGDYGYNNLDRDAGIPYDTHKHLNQARELTGLTGLGGGLGHHGQYVVRQHSYRY